MEVATHCPYCALQCGITLEPGTTPVGLKGRNFETNGGALCRKGYSAAQLLDHPERLHSPLERGADGVLRAGADAGHADGGQQLADAL